MTDPARYEERLTKVEADASTALRLVLAHERVLADLPLKVEANRRAINALGVQTAERFNQIDRRFDKMDQRIDKLERKVDAGFAQVQAQFDQVNAQFGDIAIAFADIRGRLDGTAAGLAQIVDLLTPREPGDDAS